MHVVIPWGASPAARAHPPWNSMRSLRRAHAVSALFAVALVATLPLAAAAATLRGRLTEEGSARPVEHAVVRLLEAGRVETSDTEGRFAFAHLPPGRWTLSVHHLGYADVERALVVTDDAQVSFALRPAVFHAGEILVRSSRSLATLGRTPYAVDAVTGAALREAPAVTASDALAALPGLALVRDGAWETAVSIRGMSRSSIVALVDHTRIETATDIAGGLSLVDVGDLERVEVVKSGGSVLFGTGALGGAVQLVSRRAPFSERPRGALEWTSGFTSVDEGVAQHLALEGSAGRAALRLSGGHRSAGDTETPAGPLADSYHHDWSLNGSLGLRTFGEQSALVSYQRVQAEDTGIPGGAPIAAGASARYPLARRERLALEYTLPNLGARVPLLTARVARQDIDREVEIRQSPTVRVTPHATHETLSGQLEARLLPARGHLLLAGVEAWQRDLDSRRERHLSASQTVIGERPVPLANHLSAGVYAQDEWDALPERLRLVLGARYDLGRMRNDQALNPEYRIVNGVLQPHPPGQSVLWTARTARDHSWDVDAGLHWTPDPRLATSLMVTTAYRSPSLEERYQFIDLGSSVRIGDPDLRPERSVSVDAGARVLAAGTTLRADFFVNLLTDLVAELPATWQGRPAFVKTNVGSARLRGFELAGEQRLARGTALSASLAYVRGEDTAHGTDLPQIAPLQARLELRSEAARAGTLRLGCVATHAQDDPGPGESATAGWTTWETGFTSAPWRAGDAACTLRLGARNLFDRAYRQHLSTLRGVVRLEPGRDLYATLTVAL